MKGKLIKSDIQYRLHNEKGIVIATSGENGKLSIKNCESVVNGYDLDILSENHAEEIYVRNENDYNELANFENRKRNFEEGFQKALEILGDKKFSEEDMAYMMTKTCEFVENHLDRISSVEFFNNTIKSIQPKEWDVEVEIDTTPLMFMGRNVGKSLGILPDLKPKLDKNGCLILKKK
jgi:hypothetical protein